MFRDVRTDFDTYQNHWPLVLIPDFSVTCFFLAIYNNLAKLSTNVFFHYGQKKNLKYITEPTLYYFYLCEYFRHLCQSPVSTDLSSNSDFQSIRYLRANEILSKTWWMYKVTATPATFATYYQGLLCCWYSPSTCHHISCPAALHLHPCCKTSWRSWRRPRCRGTPPPPAGRPSAPAARQGGTPGSSGIGCRPFLYRRLMMLWAVRSRSCTCLPLCVTEDKIVRSVLKPIAMSSRWAAKKKLL